jgi:hypothetical protein
MPSGWAVGDLLIYFTSVRNGSETLATPSGWQNLGPEVNTAQVKLFGRIAQGGDTAPTCDWSGSVTGFATVFAFTGDVYQDIATIVHASKDRATSNTSQVNYGSTTTAITVDNCMIIEAGRRFKTVTADGATFNTTPTNFTKISEDIPNGSTNAAVFNTWQQTTATTIGNTDANTLSIVDSSGAVVSIMVALLTASGGVPRKSGAGGFSELRGGYRG